VISLNPKFEIPTRTYTALIIFILLLVKITNQWYKKSLTYAYGFSVRDAPGIADPSFYEIATAFPQMEEWYGWLAGIAYSAPYSMMGLIMGACTEKVNRKVTLGICVILAGLS
jgi:hypothetical protein